MNLGYRSAVRGYRCALLIGLLALPTVPLAAATTVDGKAIASPDQGANWLSYGYDYSEQRFSPLRQLDDANVKSLGLAWFLDLPAMNAVVATPLAIDGVLYFTGSWSAVFAVDGATGKQLWVHDPKVLERLKDRKNLRLNWGTNRGLAAWGDKLYVGTADGRLIAIERASGRQVWSVQTFDADEPRYITGAPRAFNGKVIIGHGGAEFGPVRGYVTTYDADTGKQLWRAHTVPGNPAEGFENAAMERAAKTWTGEWWKHGGGGTVWNAMTYDPEFNRVYLGTGNGAPWNHRVRSPDGGDNLYLCSILALDADSGEYLWHYQVNPAETWDYNAAMDIVLAEIPIEGTRRKVILQAPKNGFLYVLDRASGKLLSAGQIGKVNWAERIDIASGRPVETSNARYADGDEVIWPSILGAHNWQAMAHSPRTGLSYIPYQEMPSHFNDEGIRAADWKSQPFELSTATNVLMEDLAPEDAGGALLAWDPVRQRAAWRVDLGVPWNGGVLATAGNLVFQGGADGHFSAYAADRGDKLWSFYAGLGISAAPISYAVDGRQYVAILVGWGGGGSYIGTSAMAQHGWEYGKHPRRLLVFARDGKAVLPALFEPRPDLKPLDDPQLVIDTGKAARGEQQFATHCFGCHGSAVVSGGGAPELRASPIAMNRQAFGALLQGGARQAQGMPRFAEFDEARIDELWWYIRRRARETLQD